MVKKYKIEEDYESIVSEPEGWVKYLNLNRDSLGENQISKIIMDFARRGIPFTHARLIYQTLGMDQQHLCDMIGITTRTFQRNIKENKMLNINQSEKVLEAGALLQKGLAVFGSSEKFVKWLNTFSPVLSVPPICYIDTHAGIRLVVDELNRIEYGIY